MTDGLCFRCKLHPRIKNNLRTQAYCGSCYREMKSTRYGDPGDERLSAMADKYRPMGRLRHEVSVYDSDFESMFNRVLDIQISKSLPPPEESPNNAGSREDVYLSNLGDWITAVEMASRIGVIPESAARMLSRMTRDGLAETKVVSKSHREVDMNRPHCKGHWRKRLWKAKKPCFNSID